MVLGSRGWHLKMVKLVPTLQSLYSEYSSFQAGQILAMELLDNVWRQFSLSQFVIRGCCLRVEFRDAGERTARHTAAPTIQNYLLNVSSAVFEKPWMDMKTCRKS